MSDESNTNPQDFSRLEQAIYDVTHGIYDKLPDGIVDVVEKNCDELLPPLLPKAGCDAIRDIKAEKDSPQR